MLENLKKLATQFYQEGVLAPVSLFSPDEVEKYQLGFQTMESYFENKREDYENLHLYFSWADELATHPSLLDVVESIIGPDILIYGSLVLSKLPKQLSHLSWHQDSFYLQGYNSEPFLTAWIALTESTVENGCMSVIPSSHHNGILPHFPFSDEHNLLKNRGVEIKISPPKNQIRDIILNPGEISFHHGSLIHYSLPNKTDHKRTGFIVRFVTPQLKKAVKPVLRVRGNTEVKHLRVFKKKSYKSIQERVSAYLGGVLLDNY